MPLRQRPEIQEVLRRRGVRRAGGASRVKNKTPGAQGTGRKYRTRLARDSGHGFVGRSLIRRATEGENRVEHKSEQD
jgi:hypothetical protein